MARFSIYSKDGSKIRFSGEPTYNGSFGKVSSLSFNEISSPYKIDWEIGDYVEYSRTGQKYYLYDVPAIKKQARKGTYGAAFVYSDVKFLPITHELEVALYRDLVMYDNTIHFSSNENFATYEDVYGIARRIEACLNEFSDHWSVKVIEVSKEADADLYDLLHTVKEFSVSDGATCLEALDNIYSLWKGIGWVNGYDNALGKDVIYIGRPNVQDSDNTSSKFLYGKGKGLRSILKQKSSANDIATRLYVYGSTRNMIGRYYNNLTPPIYQNESVHIPNLMIPVSEWGITEDKSDARKAYIENAEAIEKYGLIPKIVRFDGSGDYEDIYPSIHGVTIGDLKKVITEGDKYYPYGYEDSVRLDKVLYADSPLDDGIIMEGETGKQTIKEGKARFSGQHISETQLPKEESSRYVFTSEKLEIDTFNANKSLQLNLDVDIDNLITGSVKHDGTLKSIAVSLVFYSNNKEIERIPFSINGGGSLFSAVLTKTEYSSGIISSYESNTLYAVIEFDFVVEKSYQDKEEIRDLTFTLDATIPSYSVKYSTIITAKDTFSITIPQIGFNIQEQAVIESNAVIAFRTGMCAGREFVIQKGIKYNEEDNSWTLNLTRVNDTTLSQYFPNSMYPIMSGDEYVILGISLPSVYIKMAEMRLLVEGQKLLENMCIPKMAYEPEIDPIIMAESGEVVVEGMYIHLSDSDVIETEDSQDYVLIDSITIEESSVIPTYRITLRDEKKESFLQRFRRGDSSNEKKIFQIQKTETQLPLATKASGSSLNIGATTLSDLKDVAAVSAENGDVLTYDSSIGMWKNKKQSDSDKNYVHEQMTPSADWTITHNLNKIPSVVVTDTAGTVVIGEITYDEQEPTNKLTIHFSAEFAGKAIMN